MSLNTTMTYEELQTSSNARELALQTLPDRFPNEKTRL